MTGTKSEIFRSVTGPGLRFLLGGGGGRQLAFHPTDPRLFAIGGTPARHRATVYRVQTP